MFTFEDIQALAAEIIEGDPGGDGEGVKQFFRDSGFDPDLAEEVSEALAKAAVLEVVIPTGDYVGAMESVILSAIGLGMKVAQKNAERVEA
jgi:hypothetical protein